MKKILFLIAIAIYVLPAVVLAHPGRTDADGGHVDHSTGEYHYHHGYPAHKHYDIDGNWTKDCPYEFRDKTDPQQLSTPIARYPEEKKSGSNVGAIVGITCVGGAVLAAVKKK